MSNQPTPIHGNYHGYYAKRPFQNDERLLALPAALFKNSRVLDVGCNEGWVSCEIAQNHGAKLVVGVDIDDSLIQGAWRRRRAVWSAQSPSMPLEAQAPEDASEAPEESSSPFAANERKRKRADNDGLTSSSILPPTPKPHYFPASCEHEFGSLPIPPSSNRGKDVFPHNVTFRTADWVNQEVVEDKEGYDVVLAFSISKWIHLNACDAGLLTFFQRVHGVLKAGGTFVLEPQSWESYAKAKRMDPRLKENAKGLRVKPDEFGEVLKSVGFAFVRRVGVVGEGGFNRPIDLYVKQ